MNTTIMSPGTSALKHPHWNAIEQKLVKRFGSGSDKEKWARYAIGAHLMNDPDRVRKGLLMLTEAERRDACAIYAGFGIELEFVA